MQTAVELSLCARAQLGLVLFQLFLSLAATSQRQFHTRQGDAQNKCGGCWKTQMKFNCQSCVKATCTHKYVCLFVCFSGCKHTVYTNNPVSATLAQGGKKKNSGTKPTFRNSRKIPSRDVYESYVCLSVFKFTCCQDVVLCFFSLTTCSKNFSVLLHLSTMMDLDFK